ncbi:hypothetical protein HGRIS_001663 [Hohenbuehelia grisea]|uniref:Calcineurin-like phosphoesterase domain-containing protein n=1 Tax=Hohenbuehelia grisea TaxID=104357 RepID=A0ABR3JIP7_9AGAR
MDWLYALPHKVKIIIAGNHDLTLHEGWYDDNFQRWHRNGKEDLKPILDMLRGPEAQAARLVYLQDESHSFQTKRDGRTWTVYGSPWSPEFFNWAFNYERDKAEQYVGKYPRADILLTHGPPYNALDATRLREHVGCRALAERLPLIRPRIHLFGHIHEAHGARVIDWDLQAREAVPWNTPGQHAADAPEEIRTLDEDDTSLAVASVDGSLDAASCTFSNGAKAVSRAGTGAVKVDAAPDDFSTLGRTVIVNAANWPTGPRAWRDGANVPFGGIGFQPVIVDLKD